MKYLQSTPFSSPPASKAFVANYPFGPTKFERELAEEKARQQPRVRLGDVIWTLNVIGERVRRLTVQIVEPARFNARGGDGWNDFFAYNMEDGTWICE